jgi:hypothetical protein
VVLNFVYAKNWVIILFIFESFVSYLGIVVQNELRIPEKFPMVIKIKTLACGNRELHATPSISAIYCTVPLGNFIKQEDCQIKKNPFTIRDSYKYQALSNQTTFRPILSGATVPLK